MLNLAQTCSQDLQELRTTTHKRGVEGGMGFRDGTGNRAQTNKAQVHTPIPRIPKMPTLHSILSGLMLLIGRRSFDKRAIVSQAEVAECIPQLS